MTNPLLLNSPLPPFKEIQAEHVEPAISELISLNLKSIDELLAKISTPTWDNLIEPIEDLRR